MPQIFSRGDSVYQCDVCNRRVRTPANEQGIEIIQRCIITNKCPGKLHRVILRKDVNATPASTPSVVGLENWYQRRIIYNYTQGVEALTWTITHELGSIPTLQVMTNKDTADGVVAMETTDYELVVVDLNTVTVTFGVPQSGTIQCIAHASVNTTNPQPKVEVPVDTNQPVSNTGIVTIATLAQDPPGVIDIRLTMRNPINGTNVTYDYSSIDNIPDAESPWAGAQHIMVAGRTYDVRSFNIHNPDIMTAPFVNGSPISIAVDMATVTKYKECLVLLGVPPYEVPDRVTDKYVDIATISATLPEIYYNSGEVYCGSQLVRTTYPPIVVVE
jgi:hypothetical protein